MYSVWTSRVQDAVAILNLLIAPADAVTDIKVCIADTNNDSTVNVVDAVSVIKTILGE